LAASSDQKERKKWTKTHHIIEHVPVKPRKNDHIAQQKHTTTITNSLPKSIILPNRPNSEPLLFPVPSSSWKCQREKLRWMKRQIIFRDERFFCALCTKNYPRRDSLLNHIEGTHTDSGFNCDYCGLGFKTKTNMRVHISRHHRDEHKLARGLNCS